MPMSLMNLGTSVSKRVARLAMAEDSKLPGDPILEFGVDARWILSPDAPAPSLPHPPAPSPLRSVIIAVGTLTIPRRFSSSFCSFSFRSDLICSSFMLSDISLPRRLSAFFSVTTLVDPMSSTAFLLVLVFAGRASLASADSLSSPAISSACLLVFVEAFVRCGGCEAVTFEVSPSLFHLLCRVDGCCGCCDFVEFETCA